jgi:hypothetical protein
MKTVARLMSAVSLATVCGLAHANPIAIAFGGSILSYSKAGTAVGKVGDKFGGKIIFDTALVPGAVQNDGGVVKATAGASGGCSVYVNGVCDTNTGPVPPSVLVSGTVYTSYGDYSFGPVTDGSFTSGFVSRTDGVGAGGGQEAKYTFGNYSTHFDANAAGYARTTYNQAIALVLNAASGGLFANAADLEGHINDHALTSGLFTFSSTQLLSQCRDVGLFSCQGNDYSGSGYPQVDLVGTVDFAVLGTPEVIPEPGSIALLLAGAAGLAIGRRRLPVKSM